MPSITKWTGDEMGYKYQRNIARVRPMVGAKKNGKRFARVGRDCSLKNSFKASASGCGMPVNETLFGPLRS